MTATPTIAPPIVENKKMFIGGQWVDSQSGKTFESINPSTGDTICQVAEGDKGDIDLAVQAARKALESKAWARMSHADRGRLMFKLADLIEDHLEELAALETLDNGKPINESRYVDIPKSAQIYRYYGGWADKIHGKVIPTAGPYTAHTRREPVGVVGQIIPWNFPALMQSWKWGPALACGNTVILKPAEQTPLTALRIAELAQEAGFPEGVINVVPGYGPTAGAALVEHMGVDKIAFTGSTEVGQLIAQTAARTNLKRVTLELGGKNPNVVFADSDLKAAAKGAFMGIFFNQGQVCTAGSRLFVEDKAYDDVVGLIKDRAEKQTIGDPFDTNTTQGPQVTEEQMNTILGYIEAGKTEGASCITGGGRVDRAGFYVKPTIFTDVNDDMKIAREEIFGPVLCAMKFSDVDEAVRQGNNTTYGLAAAVWTNDLNKANKFAAGIKAGTVWVNCYNVFDPAVPFGGFKMSGMGREMGEYALDHYTEVKSVITMMGK